ncbi:hypothetical protein PVAP13_8NG295888 [Panicum virgatum]|uniref:non-specific serine/threonine protein kinase n=1 Tax=Panicum virgatum TaxID=38727 RepID=A0A8T0PLT9_PANVG|nr:hypothetical protein PVAP13_8NG295888 [Panicum virgatum]
MADPVATVEKIVKIGLKIKDAVDKARHNEEDCREISKRAQRFSAILSQLQQTGTVADSPAMAGALEDLEKTLQRALELVTAFQERSSIRRLIAAGDLSKQLRRVQDDILNKVMLASFPINAHTTVVLLTIQAGGHPLPRQQQARDPIAFTDVSNNIHSTEDARSNLNGEENIVLTGNDATFAPLVALKNFSLSELKDAINGGNIIGQGGASLQFTRGFNKSIKQYTTPSFPVYKAWWNMTRSSKQHFDHLFIIYYITFDYKLIIIGVLMDGKVVAIKAFKGSHHEGWDWEHTHGQLLLASKLQYQNIVKVLGYGHKEVETQKSSVIMRLLKHKNRSAKQSDYFWVEEYVPNGTLHTKIHESRLDWASLSQILEGVAQGIHYLHEQHVVHMDLKPNNILLDSDMNPKIIDFEVSMVLNDDETTDDRVVGTVGYMAREYMMNGIVSMKIDVFAFGVILLETVSRSMCRSKPPEGHHHTYEWAWEAWEAGLLTEELFDPSLIDGSQGMEITRWVQADRADRPTIADVLEILNGKEELPTPKKWAVKWKSDEGESDKGGSDGSVCSDGSLSPVSPR